MKYEDIHVGMTVYVKDLVRPYVKGLGRVIKKDSVPSGISLLQVEVRLFDREEAVWLALPDVNPATKLAKLLYDV